MSMTANDIEALSKRFCELTGSQWHEVIREESGFSHNHKLAKCSCGIEFSYVSMRAHIASNPDFTDAREVWKVIPGEAKFKILDRHKKMDIAYLFTDETGLLLKEAVEWLEGRK